MCHPWVTDEGRAPLRSCADLGLGSIEVTTQEQLGAIDRASVVSMIRARLKEKVFRSNEYVFQAVSGSSFGQRTAGAAAVQLRGPAVPLCRACKHARRWTRSRPTCMPSTQAEC